MQPHICHPILFLIISHQSRHTFLESKRRLDRDPTKPFNLSKTLGLLT